MTLLRGFDISGFQSATWTTPCDFLFVKATEGSTYKSGRFAAQWAGAGQHAKVRGAYHFARPEESSGASQADRLLAAARAVPGEMLCLDLEASKLNQPQTNAWAREFGDRLREKAPGVTTVLYLGAGYASNGTGRDLSQHFDLWWYPQYPTAANTSTWKTSFTPWLPSGLTTGWKSPHIWQFTDNFDGLDASVAALTVAQLAGTTPPSPPPPPPAPQPKPWPGRLIKVTSPLTHNADVKWVQQHLNSHGASPKVTVDSQYGPKTRDAVRAFQRKQKLDVDGIVGRLTWNALAK